MKTDYSVDLKASEEIFQECFANGTPGEALEALADYAVLWVRDLHARTGKTYLSAAIHYTATIGYGVRVLADVLTADRQQTNENFAKIIKKLELIERDLDEFDTRIMALEAVTEELCQKVNQ